MSRSTVTLVFPLAGPAVPPLEIVGHPLPENLLLAQQNYKWIFQDIQPRKLWTC